MSKMYGRRRVVLEQTSRNSGNRVTICGSREPGTGGLYAPVGYWYEQGGLFYADLVSREQQYGGFCRSEITNKGLGGLPTKKALREFVMDYWNKQLQK